MRKEEIVSANAQGFNEKHNHSMRNIEVNDSFADVKHGVKTSEGVTVGGEADVNIQTFYGGSGVNKTNKVTK